METGQRVKIANTNSIWDGKEGVLEGINGDKCTVFVDFIPEENKRVRQDFNIDNVQEIGHNNVEQPKEQVMEESASMEFTRDERAQALADYLGEDVENVENTGINLYTVNGSDEYFVVTEEEAEEEAGNQIEQIFDDMGLEAFTESFRDYIINNCVNTNPVYEWMLDSYRSYVDDIESENDYTYGNRLIEELYDNGLLEDDDFEVDEDGEILYDELRDSTILEDKKEEYAQYLADTNDPMSWLHEIYSDEELGKVLVDNGLIDINEVIEECIRLDGIAHFLAYYDGNEHDLGNGLYAYQTN